MEKLEKHLKKLTFKVSVYSGSESKDQLHKPVELSFIYGIGTEGLSDFEMAIDGMNMHEIYALEIDRMKIRSYFGWLNRFIDAHFILPADQGAVIMKFELLKVSIPEPREIVTAIAELQSHGGCGTDCGCGCH